jgi:RimJ/RimL family protein N-acetyltransferase
VAKALLAHALGDLRLPQVEAFIDPENAASAAVLRKAGMRDAGLTTGPYGSKDRRFALEREQWQAVAGR